MQIKDMFIKPIDRDIKGVIKVGQDDGANIYQELDEYVVTKELSKHFKEFFENYRKGIMGTTDNMGVWISGFFGSGKSHFLKILSYLLENKEVNGRKAIEFFTDGKKINEEMVIADIKMAEGITTDVVLFNIDSKSTADSKSNKEAVIEVFLKVFNEMQGYCGSIPFLADLERKLSESNLYDVFKAKFEKISGSAWEDSREDFYFVQDDIIQTLSEMEFMSEDSARNWCENAGTTYKISIQEFARMVKIYCDGKGKKHHIVFLVDEIGQYIAGDTNLMLNLQTVTEDLGTACKGKAWVVVTSQQDIDSVVKVVGNDFSKIQGRFHTRLSLSSANADEVIRKRILEKNETALDTLRLLYDQKEAAMKNIIIFTTDTPYKHLYENRDEFAAVYPFIPYQFNLLGQVLTSIRTHGATGKHLAEGERSMLALFQESAMHYKEKEEGMLIPFNIFYNALDKFIDHTHRTVISQASENKKLNPFDVEVLKSLFMVKYVKEIKSNIDNITTLMITHVDEDRVSLRKNVEEAVYKLIKETLVQKNGEIYIFLTNEEQDINKAINNEHVDMGETIAEVSTGIFQDIIKDNKYKYTAPHNGRKYDFPFNQIVDSRIFKNAQGAEFGIKILTPYSTLDSGGEYSPETLRMLSLSEDNVIVYLPSDMTFLSEIEESLKITKYISKQGTNAPKSQASLIRAKQDELMEKKLRIKIFIEDAIKNSDMYVKGSKLEIQNKEPWAKMGEALSKLVIQKYNKLSYMETMPSPADISNTLTSSEKITILGCETKTSNNNALDDLMNYINLSKMKFVKNTLKGLMERYSAAPYGFDNTDVQWLVATLFRQGKLSLTISSQVITVANAEVKEIVNYLTKKEYFDKVVIEEKEVISEKLIKTAKEVLSEMFTISNIGDDEDIIMKLFKKYTLEKIREIENKMVEYKLNSKLPGRKILEEAIQYLGKIAEIKNPKEFYEYVDNISEDLFEIADEIQPVFGFFESEQKVIFEKSLQNIKIFESSRTYISNQKLEDCIESIKKITSNPSPYKLIFKLPELNTKFVDAHGELLEIEAAPMKEYIEANKSQILNMLSEKSYEDKLRNQYIHLFNIIEEKLNRSNKIADVKNIRHESEALRDRFIKAINIEEETIKIERERLKKLYDKNAGTENQPLLADPHENHKITKVMKIEDVAKKSTTVELKDERDIDEFLKTIKEKMLEELNRNKNTVINFVI